MPLSSQDTICTKNCKIALAQSAPNLQPQVKPAASVLCQVTQQVTPQQTDAPATPCPVKLQRHAPSADLPYTGGRSFWPGCRIPWPPLTAQLPGPGSLQWPAGPSSAEPHHSMKPRHRVKSTASGPLQPLQAPFTLVDGVRGTATTQNS